MNYPIEEIIDRYTQFVLKLERRGSDEKLAREVHTLETELNDNKNFHPSKDKWVSEMFSIHRRMAENRITVKHGHISDPELMAIGLKAVMLHRLNAERIELKKRIACATGGYVDTFIKK